MTQNNLLEIRKTLALAFEAVGNLPDEQREALEKMFQHVYNHSVAMDNKLQHMTSKAVQETIARRDLESVIVRLKTEIEAYHRDGVNIAKNSILADMAERGQVTLESAVEFAELMTVETNEPDVLWARHQVWAAFFGEKEWAKA